jgi:hypothetical protein
MILKITLLTGKIFDLENEFDFPLHVLRNGKASRLTLRIDTRQHRAVLSVPTFCTFKQAREFVIAHRAWIEDHLLTLPPQIDFTDGEDLMLLGTMTRLSHCPDSLGAPRLDGQTLIVGGDAGFFHRRVKDYIKRAAQSEFERRSRLLAARLGVTLARVTIKDTKSRWGSCSTRHNINYSWRVALAPDFVIDYLMAHEVSHLRHPDHSAAFWQCVKDLDPDFEQGRNWLKNHGRELYRYR